MDSYIPSQNLSSKNMKRVKLCILFKFKNLQIFSNILIFPLNLLSVFLVLAHKYLFLIRIGLANLYNPVKLPCIPPMKEQLEMVLYHYIILNQYSLFSAVLVFQKCSRDFFVVFVFVCCWEKILPLCYR